MLDGLLSILITVFYVRIGVEKATQSNVNITFIIVLFVILIILLPIIIMSDLSFVMPLNYHHK